MHACGRPVVVARKRRWPGFLVPDRERHLGIAYAGDFGRLRAALARHQQTGNLTIAVVGGSISSGAGALDSHRWAGAVLATTRHGRLHHAGVQNGSVDGLLRHHLACALRSWVEWLEDWLGAAYNGSRDATYVKAAVGDPRVRVANGAVPGTLSSYMSVCYGKHVPLVRHQHREGIRPGRAWGLVCHEDVGSDCTCRGNPWAVFGLPLLS